MNEIERYEPAEVAPVRLSESALRRLRESTPESTRRAYEDDLDRFQTWCAAQGYRPFPTSAELLMEYVNHLAEHDKAPATINRAIAAVMVYHDWHDLPKPVQKPARAVLKAYRAERADAGKRVRKAAALSIGSLRSMVGALDVATPTGVRDRAVLVLGFALGARRAEIAGLDIGDLAETEDGWHVVIRRSKTDRESEGREVAVLRGAHDETCPVRTVNAWLELLAADGRTAGPLFLRIDRHGKLGKSAGRGSRDGRLSPHAVALIVERTARAAGLPAAAWSGHSLRRGFATASYGAGANPLRIARHGGWRDGSATLLGYVEEVDKWQDNPLRGIGL